MIEPGEIYIADLDVAGKHRIIVVSREELNRGNYVLGVVCIGPLRGPQDFGYLRPVPCRTIRLYFRLCCPVREHVISPQESARSCRGSNRKTGRPDLAGRHQGHRICDGLRLRADLKKLQ